MSAPVRPFRVDVPEAALDDLRARIAAARWPELPAGTGWELGTDPHVLRAVCDRWRTAFDWRAHEAWMNSHRGLLAEVEGSNVHVIVAESTNGDSLPLVLLHGWPSTMSEFRHVIAPLVDPVSHGGSAHDAFDVVLLSLPGFGFSGPTRSGGWDADRMALAVAAVVRELGYDRYGVFGTDAGAYVATSVAALDAAHVVGLHLHLGGVSLGRQARLDPALHDHPTAQERTAFDALDAYERSDSAYSMLNATKPYTLAYALGDSPVGQAAWILEKFHTWTDAQGFDPVSDPFGAVRADDALAIVTAYWLTGTAGSAARFYADAGATLARSGLPRVAVPTGCAVFPGDIVMPSRRWAEPAYPNIVHWTEMPRGGHFSALEVPDLLVDDWRAFFRGLR